LKISRGLAALTLILFFQTQLVAEYLYKDEVIHNPKFSESIEQIGAELYQKSGIALRLLMLRELPAGSSIVAYEKSLMKNFKEPTILLTFSEMDAKVDILASDPSLYNYFDKKQVLSPVASVVQAFIVALFYSDSFESFLDSVTNYGGTILPLLAQKAKKGEVLGKYSGSMFNGYVDIAQQIADAKKIELQHAVGNANYYSIFALKVIFYGTILVNLFFYIRRKYFKRG